jgi:chromosome segregation protein
MRLKNLSIKGFKSFANDTLINFEEDVIGIVGPNGSGKSNIVDAVRWVLGEQSSRELRLDQMSSVIFNGTKQRKPGGLAEVTLTFDNTRNVLPTEYATVSITRRLYRSGDSEYLLNVVTCRRKDIMSLFLDTGIGSNSYAIIALCMVDDILSDKDNARLRMFEQAAGISKYKVRKRETLNKLKHTTEDLDRVEDLLFEIEGQLKNLEKQARRAQRFFELKNKYKTLSADLARYRVASIRERQRDLDQKLEGEQDRYRTQETAIRKLEAELEAGKKANLDKEKALSDRQKAVNELVGRVRGLENEKRMAQQRLQFVKQNRSRVSEDIQQAVDKLEQLHLEVGRYRVDVEQEHSRQDELEQHFKAAASELESVRQKHGKLKRELEEIIQQQQHWERELFELEKQKAVNTNRIESNELELGRYRGEVQERRTAIAEIEQQMADLNAREKAQRKTLQDLEQAEEKRKQQVEDLQHALEEARQDMARVNRDLDARRNEYQLTKSMIENLEGFPESIRFLSQHKGWGKDVPLLSDLIYVEEAYRIAIENYLEPYLNYYVVANLDEANRAIALLSKSQKGKAHFFLLDRFSDYEPPMALLPEATMAMELVQTDPPYQKLVSYLLEGVVVTEEEDLAGLEEGAPQVTFLSKNGRFIRRRFSVSGGSVGLFEGKKIGRKKNLEQLEHAIEKSERQEQKLSSRYYQLKDELARIQADTREEELFEARQALNQLEQQRVSLSTRLENFESFVQDVEQKMAALLEAISHFEQENRRIDASLAEKRKGLAEVKDRIAHMDESYREAAEQLSEASTAYNQQHIEYVRQQNKVSSLERELSFREKQQTETEAALEKNRSTLDQSGEEIRRIQEEQGRLEEQLVQAYQERKAMEDRLTQAEQSYFQARGELNELEDQLRQLQKKRQDAQLLINSLKDKSSDLKFELSSIAQRLRIEFELELNDILNETGATELSEEETQAKVERLKSRLDNYGEINPMAMEAYEEMKERYDSITRQRDDILEAKESLLQTIQEIEETATAQFLYAFEQVRLHFIDVFRSLFTDSDNCDLLLLDPENPLESKIEIVAKPKGKRPQTINQLSGGEKTLTATALLFALYLLKPAPFCIFDEVDAPLDDVNIAKFNKIIKKFSQDSQFIIVTHNKLTMAAVDTIYGVYMAEQGVSGVSAVDFRHFEETGTFELAN